MIQLAFLLLVAFAMWAAGSLPAGTAPFIPARVSLGYGFLMLEAYILGEIVSRVRLPRISGYILCGILCGPHLLGIIDSELAGRMKLIDDLALTFIALTAGAELNLAILRGRRRAIGWLVVTGTLVAGSGTVAVMLLLQDLFPFTRGAPAPQILAIGVLFGVIAVARSPTSAIAIINECRARGPFTDTVFGVTVAIDTLVILLFATAVAFSVALVSSGSGIDVSFIGIVAAGLGASVSLGVVIGRVIAFYSRRIRKDLTILLIVLSFLITYTSQWLGHALHQLFGIGLHLEPLLLATAAGFTVQNFSREGARLVEGLHTISLPIFIVFFSMAGVGLDLESLRGVWPLALLFVAVRMALTSGAGYLGCALAGEGQKFRLMTGLTFYTQAGVSLGLTQVIASRFPGWGPQAASFLVACIAIEQVIGPVTFKYALDRMGESGKFQGLEEA